MIRRTIALGLLLAAPLFAQVSVMDNDGVAHKGRNVLVAADGSLTLATDGAPEAFKLEQVSEVVFEARKPEGGDRSWDLTLNSMNERNRDILTGTIGDSADPDMLKIVGTEAGDIDVPLEYLFGLKNRQATAPEPLIARPEGLRDDTIMFMANDKPDLDKGSILTITKEAVTIESSLFKKERTYKLSDVQAVHFSTLTRTKALEGILVTISTRRGARVTGKLLEITDKVCRIQTPFSRGGKPWILELRAESVSSIQVQNGNLVYLSDMTPTLRDTWHRGLDESPPKPTKEEFFFLDRGVLSSEPGRIGSRKFRKCIATKFHVELEFKLDAQYSRFNATVGLGKEVDVTSSTRPTLIFSILADGKEVWKSEPQTSETPGQEIKVDVRGVKSLVLITDFVGPEEGLSFGIWGDPKVVK